MKLHKIVSKDDLRPVMNHIFIDGENCVASDAHMMVIIPKDQVFENSEEMPDIFLTAKQWQLMTSNKKYTRTFEGGVIKVINSDNGLEVIRIIPLLASNSEMKYPNYKAVIWPDSDKGHVAEIGVSPVKLKQLMDAILFESTNIDFTGRIGLLMPLMLI